MATRKEISQIFEKLGIEISMSSLDDRIKFQKLIYLLENVFRIDHSFRFTWYVHGPYSPGLTSVIFGDEQGESSHVLEKPQTEKQIQQMREFLKNESLSSKNLELLGSLHYILTVANEQEVKKTLRQFLELKPQFSEKDISEAYEKLKPFL